MLLNNTVFTSLLLAPLLVIGTHNNNGTATRLMLAETVGETEHDTAGKKKILLLFDVDGTLSPARQNAPDWMMPFLQNVSKDVTIGIVGGSDLPKQKEQLGEDMLDKFTYVFSENGLDAYKHGATLKKTSLKEKISDEVTEPFLKFCRDYITDMGIPAEIMRTGQIDERTGMINVTPIGRHDDSTERRAEFMAYDAKYKKLHDGQGCREKFVEDIKEEFPNVFPRELQCSIGGQISFDVFPPGWDKTFCLQYVEEEGYDEIHFFGDKTDKDGNDYEIYEALNAATTKYAPTTKGHKITKGPEETKKLVTDIMQKNGFM